MPNPQPNLKNLIPFDSDSARAAASEPRLPEPTKMASIRLFVRQLESIKARGDNLTEVLRTLLDNYLEGLTPMQGKEHKKAFTEAVQAGVNARRQAAGVRWHQELPPRADGRPHRIKVILRDGSAVYFRNYMTEVGSPSLDSPDIIINGEDEAGRPLRVQGRASELMQLVFE